MSTAPAPVDDEAVRVIAAALREAVVRYGDDSVAVGYLRWTAGRAGYPIDPADARALIRAARRRPHLRVIR